MNDSSSPFQAGLFDDLPILEPEGLMYQPEFLSQPQERELLALLQTLPFEAMRYKQYTALRQVVSYGGQYDFDSHRLGAAPPLIEALHPLRKRVALWLDVPPESFTQVLIAQYQPGTPLGWHRDVPDFEHIVGISVLGEATMRFRPYPPVKVGGAVRHLVLQPRSIYLLSGPSRWNWQHSVAPVDQLRYSITLRTPRIR